MAGPLEGLRVLEFAGIGPAPFAAMVLADMGAIVTRIDRRHGRPRAASGNADVLQRGRRSLAMDLKHPDAPSVVMSLVRRSDVLIEGFRPGVLERLGLGPDECLQARPALVYARMSGWGQAGPLAHQAGHDLNFLALSGALHAMGDPGHPPPPPLNLVADFGGGGMMLAFGIMAALWESRRSGQGQVVDAAMSDGAALLMSMLYGYAAMERWHPGRRGGNFLDGSAPFYAAYACQGGGFVAVAAIEAPFYQALVEGCGFADDEDFRHQWDEERWPRLKRKLTAAFLCKTRDQWLAAFAGADACVTPVLDMREAPGHPHHLARQAFVEVEGVVQPAPAPRFLRTPGQAGTIPSPGEHADLILREHGYSGDAIARMRERGVV